MSDQNVPEPAGSTNAGDAPEPQTPPTDDSGVVATPADDKGVPLANRLAEAQRINEKKDRQIADLTAQNEHLAGQFSALQGELQEAMSFFQQQPQSQAPVAPDPPASGQYINGVPGAQAQPVAQPQHNPTAPQPPATGNYVTHQDLLRMNQYQREVSSAEAQVQQWYGAPDTDPAFYSAVERELSIRHAPYARSGQQAPASIILDAANHVALQMGKQRNFAQVTQAAANGAPTPPAQTPEPTQEPVDAQGDPDVQLSERQQYLAKLWNQDPQKILERKQTGRLASLQRLGLAGKGRIGRSLR